MFDKLIFDEPGEFKFLRDSYREFVRWLARVIGGGGGGAGAPATGSGQGAAGGGGGGGGFAEAWGLIADLPRAVRILVGEGGRGGVGDETNEITHRGGDSAFGDYARAQGGRAGGAGKPLSRSGNRMGGSGGEGLKGRLLIKGETGGKGLIGPRDSRGGQGGASPFPGFGGREPRRSSDGRTPEQAPGAGGSGAANDPGQTKVRTGGRGASGLVVVRLYG